MTDQEARLILSAYRPGGKDAGDPEFAAALAHSNESPGLNAWFQHQCAADAALAAALASVTPPADLAARILLGAAPRPPARTWWRPLAALAALLIVFCGILFSWQRTSSPLQVWEDDSLAQLSAVVGGRIGMDLKSESPGELRHFLQVSSAPVATPIPAPLMQLRTLGCNVFTWRQQKVSIMCFHLSPHQLVHLITIEKPLRRGENPPTFAQRNGWNTATWVRGGKTYLLATKAEPAALRQILL